MDSANASEANHKSVSEWIQREAWWHLHKTKRTKGCFYDSM